MGRSKRGKNALKLGGLTVAAASATLSLAFSVTPLLPVAIATSVLDMVSSIAIPGTELAINWKKGKKEAMGNGLHYLLKIIEKGISK